MKAHIRPIHSGMSKTAVIVALILAVGLGIAAMLLNRGGGKPAAEGPLLSFDPAGVTELRMTYPDGSVQSVRKTGPEWRVVLRTKDGQERSWPAATTQVHAGLRIFANLVPDQQAEGNVADAAGTLTVTAGDVVQSLAISGQRLGGRVLVQAGQRAAWLDAAIAEMLIDTGIRAWRNPAALPGLGVETSRISIRGHAGAGVSLARVQGRWALREPLAEPAEPEVVARLLAMLAAIRVDDFCDSGPPADTGLETPVAMLSVETDSRDVGGRMVTVRQMVSVGRAADVAGRTVVAKLERSGEAAFSETVILVGEQLAAISADPMHYVSRRAIPSEPSEVGQIAVKRLLVEGAGASTGFRRTLEGWETRCGEEAWRVASAEDAKVASDLLELLTTTPAEAVSLWEGPDALGSAVAVIELSSLGGTPIGRVEINLEATRLVSLTERVRRQYPAGIAASVAEWIGRR